MADIIDLMLKKNRRAELKQKAVNYKGGRCEICGYDKCIDAFDFHHVDSIDKDFNISNKMTSWEKIKPELDKTVLLCANCHRECHAGLHPGYIGSDEKFNYYLDSEYELGD